MIYVHQENILTSFRSKEKMHIKMIRKTEIVKKKQVVNDTLSVASSCILNFVILD